MKKNLILLLTLFITITAVSAKDVIYNKETGIFHDPDCLFAKQCTKNCTSIDIEKAFEKNAKPCEKCRTDNENWIDSFDYRMKKRAEEKRKIIETPGVKKQGNFTFEIKNKKSK